ncbi:alpha-glucuronidase family glycosyl hydrolase [Sphingobacterium siyangense]|uniref:alpha-glucuronidase family glycosyl hydrolase n=1 Tax=Sphingobacterium siyangense TaxID=459529 RepID=UPI002FDCA9C4
MKFLKLVKYCLLPLFFLSLVFASNAEDGYDLWLRYEKITDKNIVSRYRQQYATINIKKTSLTMDVATQEVRNALSKMVGLNIQNVGSLKKTNVLILGTFSDPEIKKLLSDIDRVKLGEDGYVLKSFFSDGYYKTIVAGNTDIGVLYGSFKLLELLQMHKDTRKLQIFEYPKVKLRMLNHWDNLDGTIERGYAGYSLWEWQRLPGVISQRYEDYARANASVGINGTVLNNVNSSVRSLTKEYIMKAAALADIFRPYGIKVYLTAKFSAPKELGKLKTADPLDPSVIQWWNDKVKEIYSYIPDFGGFLVKANSEGQPGPGDYGRTHADGANMMAKALKPYKGVVMWRTFVYENSRDMDRAAQGYAEFKPLDGKFDDNVVVQAKYGPIDFQPREAFNPLFGSMPNTNLGMEFQITQEYFGFGTHLVYLAPLFQEYLRMDTHHPQGKIADVVTQNRNVQKLTCMAGVSNIGTDINWCGHPFAQSNWYAFGKYAWNPYADADSIAKDWLSVTFTEKESFVKPIAKMMLRSRESAVNYMEPMGLNHIMNLATHYGPGPWGVIPDWNSWDYHCSDSVGIGFDRTDKGAKSSDQYADFWKERFNQIDKTPIELLLWFHHVPWNYKLSNGKTLWDELVNRYYSGSQDVKNMQVIWNNMKGKVDDARWLYIKHLLEQQYREACWWRDGCVLYFQTFSKQPLPSRLEKPANDLKYYETIPFPDYR